jgi:acetyl-CoA C-acetyltransferase
MTPLGAVVGIGEVPTGRFPERSAIEAAIESAREAILMSGLDKSEIDLVMPCSALYNREFTVSLSVGRLVEELGLLGTAGMNAQVFAGGSSGTVMLQLASSMIGAGLARSVLVVHSDRLGTGVDKNEGIDLFATVGMSPEWEIPFGVNFSAIAGLITQRYMYETGTTPEQVAAVCVSLRKWAQLNPHAMYRKELSIEDVLDSKMLATPVHAFESNMLADGGGAYVVTSPERAREVSEHPVYLLGASGRHTHYTLAAEADMGRFMYAKAAEEAFAMAGISPKDVGLAQIYDSYPVFVLMALEEIGMIERGTAGQFFLDGHTWPGGKLPVTTNGGMLSQGHTGAGGGFAIMLETIRQLMGRAGDRQVDATFAVETATGGTYMDTHVAVLGREIP